MIEQLTARIWGRPQFHQEYEALLVQSIQASLGIEGDSIDDLTLSRLLRCAPILAASDDSRYREAAYRIVVGAWNTVRSRYDRYPAYFETVLTRLGYFPAVELIRRECPDFDSDATVGLPLRLEGLEHRLSNLIDLPGGDTAVLTDFQNQLWEDLVTGHSLSVSGPTSAGKSFVLQQFIGCKVAEANRFIAVYVVPTRALVNQLSSGFRASLLRQNLAQEVAVATVPLLPLELEASKILYILTPERMQILLGKTSDFKLDLFLVDESQSIGDDARGVVLQSVVDRALTRLVSKQIMFAAPMVRNPEVFRSTFDIQGLNAVVEDECPVPQNLILVDFDKKGADTLKLSLVHNGELADIGELELTESLANSKHPIASISWELGRKDKNLLYAAGPAESEAIALALTELEKADHQARGAELASDPELEDFARLLKEHVHPQYLLAKTIPWGVAFHYGNMPTIVRKTVEELFEEGRIKFLVCTSTLLHGINLPAKNLFLMNPTRGRDWDENKQKPIDSIDFWNLAGRAGRLGKDFQGNVYLLNLSTWQRNPLLGERKATIVPSFVRYLRIEGSKLAEFIGNPNHGSGQQSMQGIENSFVRLVNEHRVDNLEVTLNRVLGEEQAETKRSLTELISTVSRSISVPTNILERNITISPFRQQSMLDYLVRRISEVGPEQLIPLHPEESWNAEEASFNSLLRLFKRIHTQFQKIPPANKSHTYFASLAMKWMRGDPLSKLIRDAHRYRMTAYEEKLADGKRVKEPSIDKTIRDVMKELEQDLRYRYVKFTHCYNDLLREALRQTNNANYLRLVPDIPLFLEVGASSETMISFISMGMSRTTASVLAERAADKAMNRRDALLWLEGQDFVALGLPQACLREVVAVLVPRVD